MDIRLALVTLCQLCANDLPERISLPDEKKDGLEPSFFFVYFN